MFSFLVDFYNTDYTDYSTYSFNKVKMFILVSNVHLFSHIA